MNTWKYISRSYCSHNFKWRPFLSIKTVLILGHRELLELLSELPVIEIFLAGSRDLYSIICTDETFPRSSALRLHLSEYNDAYFNHVLDPILKTALDTIVYFCFLSTQVCILNLSQWNPFKTVLDFQYFILCQIHNVHFSNMSLLFGRNQTHTNSLFYTAASIYQMPSLRVNKYFHLVF